MLRNEFAAREMEGLPAAVEVAKGEVDGPVEVREDGLSFFADVLAGQKTGWFYDQRDSRAVVAPLAGGGAMLDVYCHTGGFALPAARAGAREVSGRSMPPRRRWRWRSGRPRPTICRPAPSAAPRSSASSSG